MRPTTRIAILLLVGLLPFVTLLAAGLVWLWDRHLILAWLGVTGAVGLACAFLVERLRAEETAPASLTIEPSRAWPARGREAWLEIESMAARAGDEHGSIADPGRLWEVGSEVVEAVARRMHPGEAAPLLEVRAPDALHAIEILARDLRLALHDTVPGSHLLTLGDLRRGRRVFERGRELWWLYRIVAMGVDPISAAMREIRGLALDRLLHASTREVERWLLEAYVKKLGWLAIELYTGGLAVDEPAVASWTSAATTAQLAEAGRRDERLAAALGEPLRILVLGQTNAGKSSLVNALFGEVRALVDLLPATTGVRAYSLEREGVERAVLLDTEGYAALLGVGGQPSRGRGGADDSRLRAAIERADFILMAVSAVDAARAADRESLRALRATFRDGGRDEPPLLVVMTHVDLLRPIREWSPPYDVAHPTNEKARSIRAALEAVAADLEVDHSIIVPVCLEPSRADGVDEAVVPALLDRLDEGRRVRLQRCLREVQDEERWRRLRDQALAAGRWLARQTLSQALGSASSPTP